MAEICTNKSSINKTSKAKRYNISEKYFTKVYETVLKKGGGYADVAEILKTSVQYVRRYAKRYGLTPLGQHGGYREGAGRPSGSNNQHFDITYEMMLAQQKIDLHVNSLEVGIGRTVKIDDEDIFKYCGSAYDKNCRREIVKFRDNKKGVVKKAVVPKSLPTKLKNTKMISCG